jgi:hypothetical protein
MHAGFLGRAGIGMWPHSGVNFVMQFNEVGYTHTSHYLNKGDNEGIDVDIACINTLVQYNYIHHNGGGLLICNNKTDGVVGDHRGTIVRNNVFYDNAGTNNHAAFMTVSSAVGETQVYNNTIIFTGRLPQLTIIRSADWENVGKSRNFTFKNNIFVSTVPIYATFDLSQMTNYTFNNNLFYQTGNVYIKDSNLLKYDPKITIPAVQDGYENGLLFKPSEPKVFKDGILFDGMSEKDMGNVLVKGKKYLGAFCE